MTKVVFETDRHAGRPKILFIGLGASTHTHSWIDLFSDQPLNVRLFSLPPGLPPHDWAVHTYVYSELGAITEHLNPGTRKSPFWQRPGILQFILRLWRAIRRRVLSGSRSRPDQEIETQKRWLRRVLADWKPDVVHTLGLDPAGFLYASFHSESQTKRPVWVAQLRGGSDLTLTRFDPAERARIVAALAAADQIVSDNLENFKILKDLGIDPSRFATSISPVPGTGGMDLSTNLSSLPATSKRRAILWPKAYDCEWSVALPVFEALKMVWEDIVPCRVYMLAMTAQTRKWFNALPDSIRAHCIADDRIPRSRVLELYKESRVLLAPSLVDGVPNSLYEAMAYGAFPVVSPLPTIVPVVEDGKNVIFARNLYPEEIASALRRAMTDDKLVDEASELNRELVTRIANRKTIAARVARYYEDIVTEAQKNQPGRPVAGGLLA